MAFLPTQFNQQDDQENQQNQYQQQLGSYLSGLGAQGVQQPQQQKKPATSGQFTNVQQLRDINKQAGQKLATKMANITTSDVQKTTSGLQNLQQTHQQTEQSKDLYSSRGQQVIDAINRATQNKDVAQLQNITSDDNLQNFYNVVHGITDLPELSEKYRQLTSEFGAGLVRAKDDVSQSLGNEFGQFGLIRRAVKSPTYTKGQNILDQIIAQSAGAQQLKDSLSRNLSDIGKTEIARQQLNTAQEELGKVYLQLAKETKDRLQNLIQNTQNLTQKEIEETTKQYLEDIDTFTNFAKRLFSGDLSESEFFNLISVVPEARPRWFREIFRQNVATGEMAPDFNIVDMSDVPLIDTPNLGKGVMQKISMPTPDPSAMAHKAFDKFLRDFFGLSTDTKLYKADLANVVNVDKTNLSDKVRTRHQTALLNALNRLAKGQSAEQLSSENVEQSLADIVNLPKISTDIANVLNVAYSDFINTLKTTPYIYGYGEGTKGGTFNRATADATARANPYDLYQGKYGNIEYSVDSGPFSLEQVAGDFTGSAREARKQARDLSYYNLLDNFSRFLHDLGEKRTLKLKK